MDRLTITQCTKIIKTYFENGDPTAAMYHASRGDYGLRNRPPMQAIGEIVKKFEEARLVSNIERPVHHRFARSAENIAYASENVSEDPNVSIPRRSQKLRLAYVTSWRIWHLDLHLHSYKVQLTKQLKPAYHSQRHRYVECEVEQQAVVDNFSNKIFFSDEAAIEEYDL